MNTPRFYELKQSDLSHGDYSDILAHGMASNEAEADVLHLERTGPFIPPLTLPSWTYVVVTCDFLTKLKQSGLTGYDVYPVIKKKVTKVNWRDCEPNGTQEFDYPAGNEPENYISRRKHSQSVADEIGVLWWIRIRTGVRTTYENGIQLFGATWTGNDFFTDAATQGSIYVTQKARDWLIKSVGEWVKFEDQPTLWEAA